MTTQTLYESLESALREAIALDAPLDDRLEVVRSSVRALSPRFAEAADRMVERLRASGAGARAPMPGSEMPPFVLPDTAGKLVSLADLLRDGPTVVAFHRGHWCPYCRMHAVALGEVRQELRSAGVGIVAIAPDRRQYNDRLQAEAGGGVPILADIDNGYALSLNLAIWVGAEMQAMMGGEGVALDVYQGNAGWMLPIPATFVVARSGEIVARHIDPDYRRRMDVDLLLKAARDLRQAA